MEALGIDVKLFLGQIINFLILLLILWLFAYKPILKMLNDRREKVATSLENAKEIEEKLAATEARTKGMISQAQKDTATMLEESSKAALAEKKEIIAATREQSSREIEKAKRAITEEKELAQKVLQKEMTQLVALATEKILAKAPAKDLTQQAIDDAIEEIGGKK